MMNLFQFMKKNILLLLFIFSINSYALELPGFRFSNFQNTDVWELAKAVRDDDEKMIKELIKKSNLKIDLKDSKYQQTLLTLSIVNDKRKAFLELLKAGANPNELLGKLRNSTPFFTAIEYQEDCEQFFIENLLKYKANVNQQIISTDEYTTRYEAFPLLVALTNSDANGNECLKTIKLLVNNGANINCCVHSPSSGLCDGVVSSCLIHTRLKILAYFVIEKNIALPKKVLAVGEVDPETMQLYSLTEALYSEDFLYEDFTHEQLGFIDKSELRKTKNEILNYLKKSGKE